MVVAPLFAVLAAASLGCGSATSSNTQGLLRSEVSRSTVADDGGTAFKVVKIGQTVRPWNTFHKGDKDGSGFLEAPEGASLMQSLGVDQKLWRTFDADQDDRLSFSEFKDAFAEVQAQMSSPKQTTGKGKGKRKIKVLVNRTHEPEGNPNGWAALNNVKKVNSKGNGKGKVKWAACEFLNVGNATRCTSAKSAKLRYMSENSKCTPQCYPGFTIWPEGAMVSCDKPWYAHESRLNSTFRCVRDGDPTPAPGDSWPTDPPVAVTVTSAPTSANPTVSTNASNDSNVTNTTPATM